MIEYQIVAWIDGVHYAVKPIVHFQPPFAAFPHNIGEHIIQITNKRVMESADNSWDAVRPIIHARKLA